MYRVQIVGVGIADGSVWRTLSSFSQIGKSGEV